MQVVLLERIEKLGQMGDVVSVRDGFARNFLLPHGKALRATKDNLARFKLERTQLEADNLNRRADAEAVAAKLEGQSFIVMRQAGELGQLYGSVSARDLAQIVTEGGFTIERHQVWLAAPIKMLGLHSVRVGLHPEVAATVTINVARNSDEAKRQAHGVDVTAEAREEAKVLSAAEIFEREELAEATEESGPGPEE